MHFIDKIGWFICSLAPWIVAVLCTILMAVLLWGIHGNRLKSVADAESERLDKFCADRQMSASCCKSIVAVLGPAVRCECFACRAERKEPITHESQELAEKIQERACNAHLNYLRSF